MTSVKCLIIILLITVACTRKDDDDLDASKTCAAEGGCLDDDLKNQIEKSMITSFHNITAMEPDMTLQALAGSMQSAYFGLDDHPEQSEKVRKVAATAQMLHHNWAGLMEHFSVTSANIVETMIPFINDAVLDQKDEERVKDAFDMIIERTEEMKQKTEEMIDSYKEVYKVLQGIIGDVVIMIYHVDNEKKRLKEGMETEENNLLAVKLAQKEFDEEMQVIDNYLESLQSDIEMLRELVGKAGRNMGTYGMHGFIEVLRLGLLAGGNRPIVGFVLDGISNLFNRDKLTEEFKVLKELYLEQQRAFERGLDRKRDLSSQIRGQRTLEDKHLAEFNKLEKQYANYGDVTSIQNALYHLKEVANALRRIIQDCTTLITTLSSIISNSESKTLFLKKRDDPKCAQIFQTILKYQNQTFAVLRAIGDSFVKSRGRDIDVSYNFLSADTYNMAASKRSEQEKLQEIESDTEITFLVLEEDNVSVLKEGNSSVLK